MPRNLTHARITIAIAVAFAASQPSVAADAEPARVAQARASKLSALKAAFAGKGVSYPAKELLVRTFKKEGILELWAGDGRGPLILVKTWPVCASSGALGPKRRQGDSQVPEGIYTLDKLNPVSSYHLSLHVDYPSRADRIAGKKQSIGNLGGDIMVHGECVTIGCIPIENDPIEELYLAILDAGLHPPIHIFPARLDGRGLAALLPTTDDEGVRELWRELALVQRAFDDDRRIPHVAVDAAGRYVVAP